MTLWWTCLKSSLLRAVSAALVLLVTPAVSLGQDGAATLASTVVDESGAVVPGATVTVENRATGLQRKAVTDRQGTGVFRALPPGTYRLNVQRSGFVPIGEQEVLLNAGDEVSIMLKVAVGSVDESVVVTAQKREERAQDVPVPVTALDAQRLTTDGHLGLREYFSTVPGLSMSTDHQGRQELAIRGITTGRVSIPTVGLMIDDVPYGFSLAGFGSMPDVDPGDLSRIEILRGPQGSLYGTSSMGGIIKYVTADPVFGGYTGRVEVGTNSVHNGNGLGYNVRASANLGLSDTFAVRVSGFSREEPGYIDNVTTGERGTNQVDVRGGSLKALWRPSATASITFAALYQKTHGHGLPESDNLPGLGSLQQSVLPGVGDYDRTVAAYSATVKAKIKSAELTSITGYNVNSFSDSWDGITAWSAVAQSAFGVAGTPTFDDIRYRKIAQEVRLSVPLGRRVDGMAGAYFTRERSLQYQFIGAADPTGTLIGSLVTQAGDTLTRYVESSAFANVTYRVTDRLDVQLGGRQSHYNVVNGAIEADGPLYNGHFEQDRVESSASVFTYLVTPRFRISPDRMLYGRFASGYRPGGPNNALAAAIQPSYKSDTTRNYELGIKGELADHRLLVDASLFYIDWQDLQVQVNAPVGGYKTNGSAAKSEGVELSAALRPVRSLSIDGWFTYTNAVLTEPFPTGSPLIGMPGDRLPYSSKYAGSLSVQQNFPLRGVLTGLVGGSVSYVGDRIANFRGTPPPDRLYFPAYTRVDLRAGINHMSWAVNVFVNNVGDVRGLINTSHYILYRNTYIQPRTVGLSLTKSFF